MGGLEQKVSKIRRKQTVQNVLLATVATGGLLTLAAVAPNVISAMAKLGLKFGPRQKESIARAQKRLVQKGWLELSEGRLCITPQGESRLRMLTVKDALSPRAQRWDGKWRVLMFDIPERRKKVRDVLRRLFFEAGFLRLQDSVWVSPYNCEDVVALLKADLKIGKEMIYLVADTIEYEKDLKRHFKLTNL